MTNNLLKGVNLYPIGMMGAGKTTMGRLLAGELGYRFLDTDNLIEQIAGRSIKEIFAASGEETFRDLESQVLAEVCTYKNLVAATGGGIVLRQKNWGYLRHGIVLWLDVPVEQLYDRLQGDATRPLLQNPDPLEKLRSLLDQRQPLYAQADVRISIAPGETPEQLVPRVLEEIRKIIKPDAIQ